MIIIPGQGTQFVGMGKNLYDNFDIAKDIYQDAKKIVGEKFIELSFSGNEIEISKTEYSQVIIFLYTYSLYKILLIKNKFNNDNYFAGHSLGEVIAFALADYIKFEDALKLVRFRGEVMAKSSEIEGGMAALIFPETEKIKEELNKDEYNGKLFIANYNSTNQIVISGIKSVVENFCLKNDKVLFKKHVILKVSQAFHSPFMKDAKKEFENYLKNVKITPNENNIYSNVTSELYKKDENEIKNNLAKQIESSVLWINIINNCKDKIKDFYEIGPNSVLISFIKTVLNEREYNLINLCGDKAVL